MIAVLEPKHGTSVILALAVTTIGVGFTNGTVAVAIQPLLSLTFTV